MEFLEFQLSAAGWAPTESKVEAIVEWSAPQTVKHLRSFLGILECELAFAKIKENLTSAPVLRHFDPSLRMAVQIDGSQNAVGEVLLQWQENEDNSSPVAFMPRKLSGAQYR